MESTSILIEIRFSHRPWL